MFSATECQSVPYRLFLCRQAGYVPGNGRTYAKISSPVLNTIRKIASELDCPIIDLPRLLEAGGLCSADIVAQDGLHLTTKGNAVYAELIGPKLMGALELK